MRHCLIMTVYKDLPMIKRFISAVPADWGIYVHIDAKSALTEKDIPSRANVWKLKKIYWAGWEHLYAICFLLKQACKERYDYYHIVSGQDFFASSPERFDELLGKENMNYVDLFRLPGPKTWWEGGYKIFRYKTLSSYCNVRKTFPRMVNKLFYLVQKLTHTTQRLPDLELYGGSVYSSLQYDFVTWMLSDTTAMKLLNSLKHTACAEEVYFQTVLMNSPFKGKVIGKPLRYVDWSVIPSPKYLTEEDYTPIVESEGLFCRKVDSRLSDRLVSRLEDYIVSNKEN